MIKQARLYILVRRKKEIPIRKFLPCPHNTQFVYILAILGYVEKD